MFSRLHKSRKFVIFFFLIGSFQLSLAQTLTPEEQQIKSVIEKNHEQAITLLEKLVNINSGTSNTRGVYKVGKIVEKEFKKLGFHTSWFYQPPEMQKAGTFIAEFKGNPQAKNILLIGHLDTVFPATSRFQKYIRNGNLATGPGVIDDKGGVIVILYALKALAETNTLKNMNITVVLTGDEEESGKPTSISRAPLIELGKKATFALDFECSDAIQTAAIARRGITNWQLVTSGNEGHSSEIFSSDMGYGAIFEAAHILETMRKTIKGEGITFNPGMIIGGTTVDYDKKTFKGSVFGKENIIAKHAISRGDLRYLSDTEKNQVKEQMLNIANKHLAGTTATFEFQDGIPAMPPTDNNMQLLKQYSEVSESLGYGPIKPLDVKLRGAGDISYVAADVPYNLVGLGPLGDNAHSEKESIDLSTIKIQTERAAILVYRLSYR